MVKIKMKKRKLVKKSDNTNTNTKKIVKKLKPNKKKKKITTTTPQKSLVPVNESSFSSSSDDEEEENSSEQIQKLLEPYTKNQLIKFLIDAAITDDSLSTRIRETADRDVSHRKIFVHGLGWDTTRETLVAAFQPFGEIEDCNLITDRVTGKAKGFGFVLYKSRKGAFKALKQPRKMINNRMASCQLASLGPAPSASSDSSSRKIYVSNVQADVDSEKLRVFFEKFGKIEMGPMGFDVQTGKSRGFALFVYKNMEGVRKVLEEPYKMFDGHQLHCQKAADGKNKGTVSAAAPVAPVAPTPQVLAAVAAAQNRALFSQHPGLNPMYSGLFGNPNGGFFVAGAGQVNPLLMAGAFGQVGAAGGTVASAATGIGGYGGAPAQALGVGGNQSVLGASGGGSTGPNPMLQGMGFQHAYPTSQVGHSSAGRPQGASGSFSGYSYHL